MTTRTHLEAATRWLNDLTLVTAGKTPVSEIKPRIAGMVSLLCERFPEAAFSRESLEACAASLTFFPSYAELLEVLSPWWRERRPLPPLITQQPAELPPERTEAELNHVTQLANEVVAALRHSDVEKEAYYAAQQPAWRRPAAQMTRAQLNEAYKRAGVQGPQLPKPGLRVVS